MGNSIIHIGLQVTENDVDHFYKALFDFNPVRTFILTKENAARIFGMPTECTVLVGSCPEMELELFIQEGVMYGTFNHVCFNTHRMAELIVKAKQNGYECIERQPSDTVFIRDSNRNLFEIKPSIHLENHD